MGAPFSKRSFAWLLAAAPVLVTALASAGERPNVSAADGARSTARRGQAPVVASAPAVVASIDEARGQPTLLWAARSAAVLPRGITPEEAALEHLSRHAARYGLSARSLSTARVESVHDTGRGGLVVVLRQSIDGVEVFHHDAKVLMDRSLALVAIGGSLHPAAESARGGFALGEDQAAAAALADLYDTALSPSALERGEELPGGYRAYRMAQAGAVSGPRFGLLSPLRLKRVYFSMPDRLVPGYFVEIDARAQGERESDAYAYVIAADDGRLLYRENLTHHDAFSYRVWADPAGDHRPGDSPLADHSPYPGAAPDGAIPKATAPVLVSIDGFNKTHDPWLPAGATETSGNNVDAYTDDDAPDGFSAGDLRASVTSPGTFDRSYALALSPQASSDQRMASVASLFYTTNWLHDWWYDSGFDEAGKNAQKSNFGRGGVEGDPLLAEAQNGAPGLHDNSNLNAFADGKSPRMQMFVWTAKPSASLTWQPGNQTPAIGVAAFGPQTFNVSGQLALVDDGTAPATDACQAIVNNVAGKIAVVDRGNCTFQSKASRAEAAGAIGVILVDSKQAAAPPALNPSPDDGQVTIPMVSLTLADGAALKSALAGGAVSATLDRALVNDLDGTIDNTVVAHEWGHYLHLRSVACNSTACGAESVGWGDFVALSMMVREGDNLDGAFAIGQFAGGGLPGDPAYFGLRRYPYSVDPSKSPLTFKHITSGEPLPAGVAISSTAANDNAEVHNAGEIWASMLFESYVALLKRSAGPSPAYSFDQARRRMADYVVQGMALAPASPTYTEQRDAILAAALAGDMGDAIAIAEAFARRGAGSCAVSPERNSQDLSGVVESFKIEPRAVITSVGLDDSVSSCDQDGTLDAGETGLVTIHIQNAGAAMLEAGTATVTSKATGLGFPEGPTVPFAALPPFGDQVVTVPVSLDASLSTKAVVDLIVTLDGVSSCGAPVSLSVFPSANADQLSTGASVDTVDAKTSSWTLSGEGADKVWARVTDATGNRVWTGLDSPFPSDTSLVSPPLEISATDKLVLSFKHRHQFEESGGVFFDGGVLEVSTDAGASWQDVTKYGSPGYEGPIGDPNDQATNALKGRQGYVGQNPSYPAMDTITVDMGTSLAGKTIQLRFRIGSDDAKGASGWELDDFGLTGITNAPFSRLIDDQSTCSGGAGGGTGGQAGSGQAGAGQGGAPGGGGAGGASSAGQGGAAGSGGQAKAQAGSGGAAGSSGAGGPGASGASGHGGGAAGSGGASGSPSLVDAAPATEAGSGDSGGCNVSAPTEASPRGMGASLLGLAALVLARRPSVRARAR